MSRSWIAQLRPHQECQLKWFSYGRSGAFSLPALPDLFSWARFFLSLVLLNSCFGVGLLCI
ncbi:hypothetical protein BJ508DRAFT_132558 [Ascobolus immersus RN42]|uniref:Uncharacterized protein n=1 Tax=Ascobolus immersus RN42 TaxID=1160509 RepID=A0A3N4I1E8_ASCIM|nr:hypothetical protein BJ508DRAFT_132558 [Ascobolus immersus RN42]